LKAIAEDQAFLRGSRIRVLVYSDVGFADEELRSLKKELVPGLFTKSEWERMDDSEIYHFYLDATGWLVEPGTVFMDFHWGSERAIPKFVFAHPG
jgi:hypothetical protein